MQSNLVIEGNFVTNLFLAAQGAYNGLFAPANPPRQQTNSGSFTVNVTSSGVLSGNFFLGSETIPLINGQFDVSGAAQVHSTRHGGNPLTASLQLDLADRSLHGTVSDGSFVAMLHGGQSVFNSTHKATNYQGQYTLMCNERGGVIDDLYAYRIGADEFLLIINASRIDNDVPWLEKQLAAFAQREAVCMAVLIFGPLLLGLLVAVLIPIFGR